MRIRGVITKESGVAGSIARRKHDTRNGSGLAAVGTDCVYLGRGLADPTLALKVDPPANNGAK